MPFCTVVEWDKDFDLDLLGRVNEKTGSGDLPDGCLTRIVGSVETGARVIEMWASADHARRFSEGMGSVIAEMNIPPPDRVGAFDTAVYLSRPA